jgi:hypothetical protein
MDGKNLMLQDTASPSTYEEKENVKKPGKN